MPTLMYCNWAASGSHRPAYTQVDRLGATEERCGEVESAIFDLFAHLGATEEQLDFPVLYASARQVIPADSPAAWAMPRSSYKCGMCDPSSARQRLVQADA